MRPIFIIIIAVLLIISPAYGAKNRPKGLNDKITSIFADNELQKLRISGIALGSSYSSFKRIARNATFRESEPTLTSSFQVYAKFTDIRAKSIELDMIILHDRVISIGSVIKGGPAGLEYGGRLIFKVDDSYETIKTRKRIGPMKLVYSSLSRQIQGYAGGYLYRDRSDLLELAVSILYDRIRQVSLNPI